MYVRLRHVGSFIYRAEDPLSGLIEHELDHVLFALCDARPIPNLAEVSAWRWVKPTQLEDDLVRNPHKFTPWLPLALTIVDNRREQEGWGNISSP